MEIKLLLVKTISAAYYSSHSGKTENEEFSNLVDRVMEHLDLPDDHLDVNKERSALLKLRSLLIWMKNKGFVTPYDLNDMMTRIRVAVGDNDRLYELFMKSILLVDDPDAARDRMDSIMGELYEFIALEEFVSLLRRASRQVSFERDKIEDLRGYRDDLMAKLEALPLGGKRRAASVARSIDISDIDSVSDVFHMAQTAIDPRAILSFGFKAKNRMTGEQEGGRRGEWSNVSALPGQNKSGNLLDDFIAMCLFNKPVLFDETKKPLHVYTTIEDKLELVFQKAYVLLKQHEFNLPVKVVGVSHREMAEYVYERLTANGWKVIINEFPNGGSVFDYIDMLKGFMDEGYEIVSAGCDYVNLMGADGLQAVVAGDEVQLKHRKIRAFTAPNDIYHYTAHQLSTDAKTLSRQFPEDYVKRLPGKGYYEGCKKLDTEFDFEYIVAKTVSGGHTWQEFQWSKHRKMGATPEKSKYFVLKFQELPMIGFRYDVDLDIDTSYARVGGRVTNGSGGHDFADFGDE